MVVLLFRRNVLTIGAAVVQKLRTNKAQGEEQEEEQEKDQAQHEHQQKNVNE
jgi:hypothetical protein